MKGYGPDKCIIIDHMGNIKMVSSETKEYKPDFLPI